jgi:hypothetical protein
MGHKKICKLQRNGGKSSVNPVAGNVMLRLVRIGKIMTEKCRTEKFLPRTAGLLHVEHFFDNTMPVFLSLLLFKST